MTVTVDWANALPSANRAWAEIERRIDAGDLGDDPGTVPLGDLVGIAQAGALVHLANQTEKDLSDAQ